MRLIDADILKTKKRHSTEFRENVVAVAEIDWMPTVDAVPVVRCKDCIYWWESHRMCKRNKDKNHHCACMDCDADFFCKNGERRTDD